jgi:23S rRNA pseudouridine1911/1915/1917 synthase
MKQQGNRHNKTERPTAYPVKETCNVEVFFSKIMSGKSKTAIKQLLQKGVVTVNGIAVRRLDATLNAGSTVEISKKPAPQFKMPKGVQIIYEDRHIIIINKESGLLTMASNKETTKTAYAYLSDYLKFYHPDDKIFIVHRIDRDTSGLLIFAKNEQTQEALQSDWADTVSSRKYIAIVEGYPKDNEGTIHTWLKEHPKSLKVRVSAEGDGQEAITHYKVLQKKRGYTLVELELETGRKNQIRAHLSHIGHPIAGDVKYNAQSNPANRLCLHAQTLEFEHPTTGELLSFTSPLPKEMREIFE